MEERIYNPQFFELITLKGKSGVYQIRNLQNNHVYVGSSKNLLDRYKFHFSTLKNNKHENPYLQSAYNKYGRENFIYEIIEFCEQEQRFNVEQYWINKFYGNNCYNINKDATNPPNHLGRKKGPMPEESKRKLSESLRKRYKEHPELIKQMSLTRKGKNLGSNHVNSKPVICLETGKIYAAISEASRDTGAKTTNISACCTGKNKYNHGYHWLFKEDYDKLSKNEIDEILFTFNDCQQVVCLETDKKYISVFEAAKDTDMHHTTILECCYKKKNEAKGLHWVFYKDYLNLDEEQKYDILNKHNTDRRKKCKCIETNQTFNSIREASNILSIQTRQITASCEGQKAYTKGYSFEYVN